VPTIAKYVLKDGVRLTCCLPSMPGGDTCDRPSYELYKVRVHEHAKAIPCDSPMASHIWYTFCSERHRLLFINSHRELGNLPSGYKLTA
jgi:hypothetical protein